MYRIAFLNCALIFLTVVFFGSCKGQETKTTVDQKQVNNQETKISEQPPENLKAAPVDPMFFIEGQLASWVRAIYQDTRGNYWFGTNHYGVMHYDGDSLRYINENQGLPKGRVNCITEDTDGNIWIGTFNGLSRYSYSENINSKKKFINYSPELEEHENEVWDIFMEEEDKYWIGTTFGPFIFRNGDWQEFPLPKIVVQDTQTIIGYDRVTSIIKDKSGIYWFGKDGFGICQHSPAHRSFRHFTKANGLSDNNVTDILEDKNGFVWIGSMFGGVTHYDPASHGFTALAKDNDIKGEEVMGLMEDSKGNIWFAVENGGIYRYNINSENNSGQTFSNFGKAQGLETHGIITIYEDRNGKIWLGGWGGLFRFDGEKFFKVTKEGPWE